MNSIPAGSHSVPRRPLNHGMQPLFKEGETPTAQDSVFFRRGDSIGPNDWSTHLDRFKGITDKTSSDYMPRTQGLLAATLATGAGLATSLVSAPYSLSVAGPLVVGTALWATGNSEKGLLPTIGEQLTLPVIGASKVADTVFEKTAGAFYKGNGPTLTLHQDQDGKIWGLPKAR